MCLVQCIVPKSDTVTVASSRLFEARCPDVPARVHPHMPRHLRAMHLYQAGMPLALLTEWLGHADPETRHSSTHTSTLR